MSPQKSNKKKIDKKITIAILEDSVPLVKGMKLELDQPDMEICVATDDLERFYAAVKKHKPRVAIIDIRIWTHFEAGYEAIKYLLEISPSTLCIVYTYLEGLEDFHKGVSLGIRAFVRKNIDEISLVTVIRIINEGGTYFGNLLPEYLKKVKDKVPGILQKDIQMEKIKLDLSEREVAALELLNQGRSNEEIAEIMNISVNTVKAHTKSIRKKMGVESTREAVTRARLQNIIKISGESNS